MTDTLSSEPDAGADQPRDAAARILTPHTALKRGVMLVNPLSGGVGPRAVEEAAAILAEYALETQILVLEGGSVSGCGSHEQLLATHRWYAQFVEQNLPCSH